VTSTHCSGSDSAEKGFGCSFFSSIAATAVVTEAHAFAKIEDRFAGESCRLFGARVHVIDLLVLVAEALDVDGVGREQPVEQCFLPRARVLHLVQQDDTNRARSASVAQVNSSRYAFAKWFMSPCLKTPRALSASLRCASSL